MIDFTVDTRDRAAERRTLALIGASHFISHFYMLLLPPLFVVIQADRGWSYTQISLAIIAFYLTSTVLQTPAGYVSDRFTPPLVLVAGLALEAFAVAAAGFADSLPVLVFFFALAGIGNTVFHPAHYAIMADRISQQGIGGAYAVHTFAGFLGTAAAPVTMIALASVLGWRGALVVPGAIGIGLAVVLAMSRPHLAAMRALAPAGEGEGGPRRVLLRPEILLSLVIFALLAAVNSGVQAYVVSALIEAWAVPATAANAALSAFLVLNAFGVLAGGWLSRFVRLQEVFFCLGIATVGLCVAALAFFAPGPIGLIALLSLGGAANGVILPARDLMVRAVTPEGQFGRVFGFISTGFFVGAMVAPPTFALMLDHHLPAGVFITIGALCLACVVLTTMFTLKRAA